MRWFKKSNKLTCAHKTACCFFQLLSGDNKKIASTMIKFDDKKKARLCGGACMYPGQNFISIEVAAKELGGVGGGGSLNPWVKHTLGGRGIPFCFTFRQ